MTVLCEQGNITDAATNTAGIYYWKNLINGKGYVGKSLDIRRRIGEYIGMHFKGQPAFYAAVKKYGLEKFSCHKIMDCCPSDVALNYWEKYYIRKLDTFIDNGNGYNMTTGGDGGKLSEETKRKIGDAARNMSAETRKKLSEAMRGKKLSDETRKKMGESQRGRKCSDEVRRKIGDAFRGRKRKPFSAEHRKKLSDAQRGKKLSDETRKKISEAKRNMSDETRKRLSDASRNMSAEHRKKIGDANRGRKHTDETRKKISEANFSRHKNRRLVAGTLYNDFFAFPSG